MQTRLLMSSSAFIVFLALGCAETESDSAAEAVPAAASVAEPSRLRATLEEKKAAFRATADEEIKAIYADGIQAVRDAGVVEQAKNVGDAAPDFSLPDHQGEPVSLSGVLADGPVVIVWYRGGWCPYCNLTLRAYQEHLETISELGGTLIAISPELPDETVNTVSENELDFIVLSDVNNEVAREFGLVFKLTPEVQELYNERLGLAEHNGQDSGELPLSATYVIDADGMIAWAFLDADYRNRAEPADVAAALNDLASQ